MVRATLGFTSLLAVGALAGCASSATTTATATATPVVATAAPTAVVSASAVPTSVDPCQVVPASEASSLTGASYTAGKEETTGGGGKVCLYGSSTLNILWVIVGQSADASTAQAQFAQEEADAQAFLQNGLPAGANANATLSDVSITGADQAAVGTGSASLSGQTLNFTDLAARKSASFLFFSNVTLGHPAATAAAMQAQAQTSLGRLP
jgi:hypothetical protein